MKRIIPLVLAALLALVVCAPVMATGGGEKAGGAKTVTLYNRAQSSTVVSDWQQVLAFQELQKRTGITIKFQTPADKANPGQAINLMLASGDYPDIVYYDWNQYPGGLAKLIADKVAVQLNEVVAKYAPNYKKVLDTYQDYRRQAVLGGGVIAHFARINADPRLGAWLGLGLRGDWLDKLGLKPPITIDDWYTTLKAFRDRDPNGNGKTDEVPFTEHKQFGYFGFQQLAGAWGIRLDFFVDPVTMKMAYGYSAPGFKDFITTMASAYREGLIDRDFAAQDESGADQKWANDVAGSSSIFSNSFDRYASFLKDKHPDFKLTTVAPPVGPSGKGYAVNSSLVRFTDQEGAIITTKAKDVGTAARLLDYFYGPEGDTLINWGVEGISFKVVGGQKQYVDSILRDPSVPPYQAVQKYAVVAGWAKLSHFECFAQTELTNPVAAEAATIWGNADKSLLYPALPLTEAESQQISAILADVNTYTQEKLVKFILGTEPLSNYDSFLQTLKGMKIDDAVATMQKAWERYQANN